jgi:hypothetical protein
MKLNTTKIHIINSKEKLLDDTLNILRMFMYHKNLNLKTSYIGLYLCILQPGVDKNQSACRYVCRGTFWQLWD